MGTSSRPRRSRPWHPPILLRRHLRHRRPPLLHLHRDLYENACRLKGGVASALPLVHLFVNTILLLLLLLEARCYPRSQGPLLSRMSGGVSSVVVLKATVMTTAVYDIDHKLSANGCSSDKKFKAVRIIKHAMEIIHLLTDANSIQIIVDSITHRVTEEAMLPFCLFPALTMVVQRVRHVVHLTMDVQRVWHVHDRSRCLVCDCYGRSL